MKENDMDNFQDPRNSKAAKAASVTAGIAAGTAAVTGAKMAHEIFTENDEVQRLHLLDPDEIAVLTEQTEVEEPTLNLENPSESGPIAQNLHTPSPSDLTHQDTPTEQVPSQETAEATVEIVEEESNTAAEVEVTPVQDEAEVLVEPILDINGELELNIVGYDTVTMNDGTQSDFAFFEHEGRQGAIVDINQDGRADYMMFDNNANGNIDEAEVYDVKEENWDMAMFNPNDNSTDDLAQVTEMDVVEDQYYALDDASSDYINDADVNDFLEA